MISGGGLAAGLVLGLALVALLEFRDGSLQTELDVAQVLHLPVVAVVPGCCPETKSERVRSQRRWICCLRPPCVLTVAAGIHVLDAAAVAVRR